MNRYFIRRKRNFRIEEEQLLNKLRNDLELFSLEEVKFYNIYDVFSANEDQNKYILENILSKISTDDVFEKLNLANKNYLAFEPLPLQYDIRKDNAELIINIKYPNQNIEVFTGTLLVFNDELLTNDLVKIKKYMINPIDYQEKDLKFFNKPAFQETKFEIEVLNNFCKASKTKLLNIAKKLQMSISIDDLLLIQEYFANKKRNPNVSELTMFDIYWSDHCRHTTFNTIIENVEFLGPTSMDRYIQEVYKQYLEDEKKLSKNKKPIVTLMNLATINTRILKKTDTFKCVDFSKENNACAISFNVGTEKYFLNFKNETHNHPTEVEPYGGASTCLGGAIRDILANRAYAFAGMRISGSGNILESVQDTLKGKLPQRKIADLSAKGFSSYGNQIGLPTLFVQEYYDDSYKAKHLECGAVLGLSKAEWIRKEEPNVGDLIILFGGRTGIDGIGGASGSSKEHNEQSIHQTSSQVQKGNPIIQRNMQRLFKCNGKFINMIKKSNDFGAGGASVALGELSDGVEIYLDKFQTKYEKINPHQILFSESQERMAIVVDPSNKDKIIEICNDENLEAYVVGKITNNKKFIAKYYDQTIVEIDRKFLASNGAIRKTNIRVPLQDKILQVETNNMYHNLKSRFKSTLSFCLQKGISDQFDSSIGRTTIMSPYAGEHFLSMHHSLICKIPLENENHHFKAIVGAGFNPTIAKYSPFHAAAFSIVESLSKVVASGGDYQKTFFSFQEYFCKLNTPEKWSEPFLSLLGAYKILKYFKLGAIGGKDSMSGTFEKIDVIPSFISFGFTISENKKVKPSHFIGSNNYIYFVPIPTGNFRMPINSILKSIYDKVTEIMDCDEVLSIIVNDYRNIYDRLVQAALGNFVGFSINMDEINLVQPGSFIIESKKLIKDPNFQLVGKTLNGQSIIINEEFIFNLKSYENINIVKKYTEIFPCFPKKTTFHKLSTSYYHPPKPLNLGKCNVLILVFPGTNCEYDIAQAFKHEGATTEIFIFNTLSPENTNKSIKLLASKIKKTDILVLPGGFSAADEPDGSGKFIARCLEIKEIKDAIKLLIKNKKLILGICNGFQALVETGLLPYGNFTKDINAPTLTYGDMGQHNATLTKVRIISNNSPWLMNSNLYEISDIPISCTSGKFILTDNQLKKYLGSGQIFSIYEDKNNGFEKSTNNHSGSLYGIEGIISSDGLIMGRMGHPERIYKGLFQNIKWIHSTNIFANSVNYIKGDQNDK